MLRRDKPGVFVIGVVLAALILFGIAAGAASGATLQVAPPSAGGSDAGNCAVGTPCATIQHAVGEAHAGDTIEVAAGEYAENVTVGRELTLRGAQAGNSRLGDTGPTATESVVSAPGQVITVTGSGATIEGFSFVNPGTGGSAIYAKGGTRIHNLGVADNLLEGGSGYLLTVGNAESIVIEGNRVAGTDAAALLFTGETQAGVIRENEFVNGTSNGIQFTAALGMNREVSIVGNRLTGLGRALRVNFGSIGTAIEVRENDLADEEFAGILTEATQGFSARRNWWGCNGGPGAGGCSTLVNTTSGGTQPEIGDWLALALSAEPATAEVGADATLHADLLGSSSETRATSFPAATPIAFGASLGEVAPLGTPAAGRATATFHSTVGGVSTVSATLDSQITKLGLTVEPLPEPPPPTPPTEPVIKTVDGPTIVVTVPAPAPTRARPYLRFTRPKAPIAAGAAKVAVECVGDPEENCGGVLAVTIRGAESREAFELVAGKRATIPVPLTRTALARLKRAGKNAKASASARTVQISGAPEVRRASLRLG